MPGAASAKTGRGTPVGVSRWAPSATSAQSGGRPPATTAAVTSESRISPAPACARIRAPSGRGRADPLARVHAPADPGPQPLGPGLVRERALRVHHRGERRGGGVEDRDGGPAVAVRLHEPAAVGLDGRRDQLVVADEHFRHRRGVGLPQPRRVVDLRAADGHDARRQARPPNPRGAAPPSSPGVAGRRAGSVAMPSRIASSSRRARAGSIPSQSGRTPVRRAAGQQRERRRRERVDVACPRWRAARPAPARGTRGCRCAGQGPSGVDESPKSTSLTCPPAARMRLPGLRSP